jgi:hypothetical protein
MPILVSAAFREILVGPSNDQQLRDLDMTFNAGAEPRTSRVIYPELPDPLTPEDLHQLFSPSFDER